MLKLLSFHYSLGANRYNELDGRGDDDAREKRKNPYTHNVFVGFHEFVFFLPKKKFIVVARRKNVSLSNYILI